MWQWGCAHWRQIAWAFDLWATEGPPSYGTLRDLLAAIDAEQLNEALCPARSEEEGITVDGKVLRGSKRVATPALQVITAAGQQYRTVLAQASVTGQDMIEAAIALLQEMPLEDKIVTTDEVAPTHGGENHRGKRGDYLGPIKGNHGELYEAVNEWIETYGGDQRPPDDEEVNKGHGRIERRELWVVPALRYIPDARRFLPAHPELGLHLLFDP